MRNRLILIVFSSLLFACNSSTLNKPISADEIEITYDNSWGAGCTINISKNGIAKMCEYYIIYEIDSVQCFLDTLNNHSVDSINYYLDLMKKTPVDTLYDGQCQDCGVIIMKLTLKEKIINSLMIGPHKFNNTVAKFSRLITNLKINDGTKIDSSFIFSTTKYLTPPIPTKNQIKYLPSENNPK